MPVGWITYGLLIGDRLQVVTNSVTGGAGLAILVALLSRQAGQRSARKLVVSGGAAAAVLVAVLASVVAAGLPGMSGPAVAPLLGGVLAVVATLGAIPQPLALLRDRHQDLSGISPLRWRLAMLACASWFAYGLLTGQPAVWLSALVGLTSAGIVCAVLISRRPARVAAAPVGAAVRTAGRVSVSAVGVAGTGVDGLATGAVDAGAAVGTGAAVGAVAGTVRGTAAVTVRARARVPRPVDMPTMVFGRELVAA